MTIDATTLLFFDASCLIAAAGSPTGGSGFLLSLCMRHLLCGASSQVVLLEAERNIRVKLPSHVLDAYHNLLQHVLLQMAPVPRVSAQASWLPMVNAKDVHVVAAALAVKAPFVLTLDKRLVTQINGTALPTQALSPGDFIRTQLPSHVNYPTLRS